ncbi:lasso peptide biosynthesis protein [Luteimonas sp. BDR2-5]|uniref:transglutaminase family protein n=1 Tax=Proluteimonas luteida TaxID=2878685 RepID=UPI001E4AE07E|nr:transglutaminase domain-containing protein [Luteimonas sp. BDR2-5]MCD9028818.1 lasso peptide biosynthesis protein [Luteimonas sp. BDR2-5]
MRLQAGCELLVEAETDCPVVAMLRPRSGEAQWLASGAYRFDPHVMPTEYVDAFGNLCQRFVVPGGRMTIRVELEVETEGAIAVTDHAPPTPPAALPDDVLQYLLPSRYCPSDKTFDQAQGIVAQAAPGYAQVEAIRRWIRSHIVYRYGESNPSTDAMDTLLHGAGVCRDYAHIGIMFCRALRIPARMVVGYLHGLEPMDLHAWFEAYLDGRWYTFDATQDAPRGGRIVIAYGRDAADVAFLTNYGALQTLDMQVWVGLKP